MQAAHPDAQLDLLAAFVKSKQNILVITGAGCSTESGIPDYRDEAGLWKQSQPIQHQDFLKNLEARKRYWARSMVGWQDFGKSKPNRAHHALAQLERAGFTRWLVTQNVDGLHQAAGSRNVVDLHGRLDEVVCLQCERRYLRSDVQDWLIDNNQGFTPGRTKTAPDGDAHIDGDFSEFCVPFCVSCNGILKPDVVFFGDNVPRQKVGFVYEQLELSGAVLVVGTSLMVFSGFRFVRRAKELNLPIAAINLGVTRADSMLDLKVVASCADTLNHLTNQLNLSHD